MKHSKTILIISFGLSVFSKPPISPIPHGSLQKRSPKLNILNAMAGGSEGGGTDLNRKPCDPFVIDPQTWVDLDIDGYLQKYPNGDRITLQDFAKDNNMPNFFCGVGMQCNAGQLCHPAQGINWLILYAAQQWNNYMNSLYKAVEMAIDLVRDTASTIVSDFATTEPIDTSMWWWSLSNVVCGVIGSITALAVPAFLPADAIMVTAALASAGPAAMAHSALPEAHEPPVAPLHEEGKISFEEAKKAAKERDFHELEKQKSAQDIQTMRQFFLDDSYNNRPHKVHYEPSPQVMGQFQRVLSPQDPFLEGGLHEVHEATPRNPVSPKPPTSLQRRSHLQKRGRPSSYAFTRYSYIQPHLNALQNRIQGFVALTLKLGTMAPILSDGGLASILSEGAYLSPNPSEIKIQEGAQKLAQILVLSQFLRSLNMFVTIGSDPCKYKGPNGAKNKPGNLSYCTPDGLMMNIILSHQDKAINEIRNANLLKDKYGYTVEFLAKSAWECQKKYGIYTTAKPPPPSSMRSDCIFQLPVCDCTLPEVARLRSKKKSTVVACRTGAGLPI
ncbi:hypothetical protein DFH28DRAFT_1097451 [Melampsora americana]|nr:hypothetical protein DFH28DRAFT_1097451 [Melampsora americana]